MRIALLSTRAHFRTMDLSDIGGGVKHGLLVEGKVGMEIVEEATITFFIPFVGVELLHYSEPSINGDDFAVLSQVGFFKNHQEEITFGPSKALNDYVVVFVELADIDHIVYPKYSQPEHVKRIDMGDTPCDTFILILVKDKDSSFYGFNSKEEVLEYTFRYHYNDGSVSMKTRKVD